MCEMIETCPFFLDGEICSKAVDLLKEVYCLGNHEGCARHMVSKTVGREYVPPALYPNQTHLVPSILRRCQAAS